MDLKQIMGYIVEDLRGRRHPEKAHISVLGPPSKFFYGSIWKHVCKKVQLEINEDDDESDVDEKVDDVAYHANPSWIFGADFELDRIGQARPHSVRFKFAVRRKFDYEKEDVGGDYLHVKFELRFSGNNQIEFRANMRDESNDKLYEKSVSARDCMFYLFITAPENSFRLMDEQEIKMKLSPIVHVGIPVSTRGVDIIQIEKIVSNELIALVHEVDKGRRSEIKAFHAVGVLVGKCNGLFKAYLINFGAVPLEDKSATEVCENPSKLYTYNEYGERWVLGHLFEVEGEIEFDKKISVWSEYGLTGAHPINALIDVQDNVAYLKDYYIGEEVLAPIEQSTLTVEEFFENLSNTLDIPEECKPHVRSVIEAVGAALREGKSVEHLYTYQEESTKLVLNRLGLLKHKGGSSNSGTKAIVIMARTAGGKTLSFLIPALLYVVVTKACRGEARGTKVMLIYPTKALANDQVEEVAHVSYYVDTYLKRRLKNVPEELKITFGVLHGDVRHRDDTQSDREQPIPMTCPIHHKDIFVGVRGEVSCEGATEGKECDFAQFLRERYRMDRDAIYYDPPDILITDEDMINRILSGIPTRRGGTCNTCRGAYWFEWQLFGYPYKRCKMCLHTYPLQLDIKKCHVCGAKELEEVRRLSAPRLLVLDEAHHIYGSFGAQVHHLMSLLERVIVASRGYISGEESSAFPLYVVSSATLGKPKEFVSSLLGLKLSEIEVISAKSDNRKSQMQTRRRMFLLVMPKAYTRDATTARLLRKFAELKIGGGEVPRGIIFTNTLGESNELMQFLRNIVGTLKSVPIRIDGHSTDYDKERANIELAFKKGEIDWLVATSTLEVGVDYGKVDFVTIFGMPRKISSFLQRIGRAGRDRDALIFVVFNPDVPLDYYFFESYKLLLDGNLREKAIQHEVTLVSGSNEEAIRRATKRWLVSTLIYACANPSVGSSSAVCKALGVVDNSMQDLRALINVLDNYKDAVKPKSLERLASIPSKGSIIESEVNKFKKFLENRQRGWLYKVIEEIDVASTLVKLRNSDREVRIEFIAPFLRRGRESRSREMKYVVKRALPGQVLSFKGKFFFVKSLDGDRTSLEDWLL